MQEGISKIATRAGELSALLDQHRGALQNSAEIMIPAGEFRQISLFYVPVTGIYGWRERTI
jgi:hypothetical protein